MAMLNDRLSEGYKMMKKHGVQNTDGLLQIMNELSERLHAFSNLDEQIETIEKQLQGYLKTCMTIAGNIASNRKACLEGFTKKVNQLLRQVGMPNACLHVQLTDISLSAFGTDQVEFLFDANKREKFEPLHKVASGGELSRLMLCVKSLVAEKLDMPTMIFDEIDTGISGEAAKQVGVLLRELSTSHQLISITHQAQIAAKASAHYFIYKEVYENRVRTNVRLLNTDERITAIASMLSGEKPTAAAMQNAREMVSN
jgi:DNA repair protein RecN (Recombination protein N)